VFENKMKIFGPELLRPLLLMDFWTLSSVWYSKKNTVHFFQNARHWAEPRRTVIPIVIYHYLNQCTMGCAADEIGMEGRFPVS
jgi:hypothetical protein